MPEFFHLTTMRLAPGSIIEPGNWGRIMKRYRHDGGFGNPWLLCRELVFEQIRADRFPEKPPRAGATFGLESQEGVDQYRAKNDVHFLQVLHVVEPVDPGAPLHRGSLALLDWPPPGPFLDPVRTQAREYWSGAGDPPFEIVTTSPLRVIRSL